MPRIAASLKKAAIGLSRGAKKIAKKAKYAGEVGIAAGTLAARAANPVRRAKFVADAVRGKGFVLPGSKYIGPGNEMNKGKPVDEADANAYQHDVDYDNYIKAGVKPRDVYTGYSDADERLLKNTKANTANGLAVVLGMGAKKLLNKTGLTKRIRDKDVKGLPTGPTVKPWEQPRVAAVGNPSANGVKVRVARANRGVLTSARQGAMQAKGLM